MSFREIREQIIAENVPKLVNSLLGINVSSKNNRKNKFVVVVDVVDFRLFVFYPGI